jgi:HNH endonuclease
MSKRPPLSKQLQLLIFRRDNWICRWCGKVVIFAPVMKLLEREVKDAGRAEPLSYYHIHWTRADAPLLDELGAVIDHVEAFSTGGAHCKKNFATVCNKCNGRKSASPIDDWSKRPQHKPIKGKYGPPLHWDGLSSLFVILGKRDPAGLTVSEKDWLKVLTAERIGLLEMPARSLMVHSTGRSNRGFMLMSPKLVRSSYIPDLSRERKHLKQSNGRRTFVRVQLHFLTNIKNLRRFSRLFLRT